MSTELSSKPVRIAIIGAGAVSDFHHVPGIRIDPRAQLVAACDADRSLLEQRQENWGCERITTDFQKICSDPNVDAVIIATPNFTHKPMALAAAAAGKHVMCEKPLGLNAADVREMYVAVRDETRPGIIVYSPAGEELAYIKTEIPTNVGFGRGNESKTLYITAGKSLYRTRLNKDGYHLPPK